MTVGQMMPWDECTGENDQGAVAERADVDAGRIVKTLRKSISGRGKSHCEQERPCVRTQEDNKLGRGWGGG